MAESAARGGRRGSKRKAPTAELIDVTKIYPVDSSIDVGRHDNIVVSKDFASACGSRVVHVERLFDEKLLKEIDFPYLRQFQESNWWHLFTHKNNVLTNVVKVFYFCGDTFLYGMVPNEDPELPDVQVKTGSTKRSFRAMVQNKLIDVDEELVRKFVNDAPNDGATEVPDENSFPYLQAFREILGDPSINSTEEVKAGGMDLHNRILHLMVIQVLFPRGGDYAKARKRDIYWMYKIIHNQPINLSGMIITRMMEGLRNRKTNLNINALPYGRLVSRICKGVMLNSPERADY